MVRISIALCTYNGEAYLQEQLDSLVAQTHQPLELHVGDDGSSDCTIQIIRAFQKKASFPVYLRVNTDRLGFGVNFVETALRCSGEWVAFCDQDDIWLPNKLEKCSKSIDHTPEDLMLIVHNAYVGTNVGIDSRLMDSWPSDRIYNRLCLPPAWVRHGFRQVFNRALLDMVPISGRDMYWCGYNTDAHDTWIPVIASALGSVFCIGEPLVRYRRHEANVSQLPSQPTLADSLSAKLRGHGSAYLDETKRMESVAECLGERANLVEASDVAIYLREASTKYEENAKLWSKRAQIYSDAGTIRRLTSLFRLIMTGSYGTSVWGLSKGSLLKDMVYSLLPSRPIQNRIKNGDL